jgi:hypothetical protein
MSNRKATFAKRQRESDLKDHAKSKKERQMNRRSQPRVGKGPEIAWDQAVDITTTPYVDGMGSPAAVAPLPAGPAGPANGPSTASATAPAPAPAPATAASPANGTGKGKHERQHTKDKPLTPVTPVTQTKDKPL